MPRLRRDHDDRAPEKRREKKKAVARGFDEPDKREVQVLHADAL